MSSVGPRLFPASRRARYALLLAGRVLLATLCVAPWIGCGKPPRTRAAKPSGASSPVNQDLIQALDLLRQLDQVSQDRAAGDLAYLLNRWSQTQKADADWKPDGLADRLPRQIRELYPLSELARPTFDLHDTRVLLEANWARDISDWVGKQNSPVAFRDWLAGRQPSLDRDSSEQLKIAERLFDWTVRNIQLDPLLPYAAEAVGTSAAPESANTPARPTLPPFARGVPGPGYQHEVWQTLLMGHGDAWERARVFGTLARQQGIDTVVLAIFDVNVSPRPQAWGVAVLLGEDLFLFDPALGLPLPSADGQGVATLAELRDHPERLAALDIDEQARYPVQGRDLQHVVALVDAAPAALSSRMQRLERQLVGAHRMVLTTRPTPLADRVRKCQGINSVNLWTAPWEAEMFAAALAQLAKNEPPAEVRQRLAEDALFSNLSPLVLGRYQHFHGVFANADDVVGAKGHYLQARFPDEIIDNLGADEKAQRALGLVRDRYESDNAWLTKLRIAQIYSKAAKLHASYWLGLVHFEAGQYDVAADWFKSRTLDAAGNSPWKPGARYNLARSYEQLGKLAEARALYEEDTSPQRHGNLLRARALRGQGARGEE